MRLALSRSRDTTMRKPMVEAILEKYGRTKNGICIIEIINRYR